MRKKGLKKRAAHDEINILIKLASAEIYCPYKVIVLIDTRSNLLARRPQPKTAEHQGPR